MNDFDTQLKSCLNLQRIQNVASNRYQTQILGCKGVYIIYNFKLPSIIRTCPRLLTNINYMNFLTNIEIYRHIHSTSSVGAYDLGQVVLT